MERKIVEFILNKTKFKARESILVFDMILTWIIGAFIVNLCDVKVQNTSAVFEK